MQVLRNELYRPWFVGDTDWGFEIIDGEFDGVVVQIQKVEFKEGFDGQVDLEYHIVKQPEGYETDTKNEVFVKTVELIVNDILKEAINYYEQTRANDTSQPDSQ